MIDVSVIRKRDVAHKKAQKIVDGILRTVDIAGYFHGRGRSRHVMLRDVLNTTTGVVTPTRSLMIEWVEQVILKEDS